MKCSQIKSKILLLGENGKVFTEVFRDNTVAFKSENTKNGEGRRSE
jgi:hypothetical protein